MATPKEFEIASIAYEPVTLSPVVAMRERDPADYDWNAGTDLKPSPLVLVTILDPAPVALVSWRWSSSRLTQRRAAPPGLRNQLVAGPVSASAPGAVGGQVNATGAAALGRVDHRHRPRPGRRDRGHPARGGYGARPRLAPGNRLVGLADGDGGEPPSGADLDLTGQVDVTAFAAGTWPVEVLASLPPPPPHQSRAAGVPDHRPKFYRNTGNGWTVKSDGADILAGTILCHQHAADRLGEPVSPAAHSRTAARPKSAWSPPRFPWCRRALGATGCGSKRTRWAALAP